MFYKLFFLAVEKDIPSMCYHFLLKFVVVIVLISKVSSWRYLISMIVCHGSLGTFLFGELRLFGFGFSLLGCENLRRSHCQNGSC
jgi:hypothetical protein